VEKAETDLIPYGLRSFGFPVAAAILIGSHLLTCYRKRDSESSKAGEEENIFDLHNRPFTSAGGLL